MKKGEGWEKEMEREGGESIRGRRRGRGRRVERKW